MPPAHASPSGRRGSRRVVALVGALLVLVAVAGFVLLDRGVPSGLPGGSDEGSGVLVDTEVTRVAGPLPRSERDALRDEVRGLVEEYVESAYVDGATDFPGFTGGARRLALEDADVTTARRLPGDGRVELLAGRSRVAVLATTRQGADGATAAVRLVLRPVGGGKADEATVTGRLLLTPTADGWRIFGYDLALADPSGTTQADGSAG